MDFVGEVLYFIQGKSLYSLDIKNNDTKVSTIHTDLINCMKIKESIFTGGNDGKIIV